MLKKVLIVSLVILPLLTSCRKQDSEIPVLNKGPHLFIDDVLIDEQSFLARVTNNPEKLAEPVLRGGDQFDKVFQPYLSVIKDSAGGKFRMWFNVPVESKDPSFCHIGYTESTDGIHWERPPKILSDTHPIQFNVSVIDRGAGFKDKSSRYIMATYQTPGMRISASPDGFEWRLLSDQPAVKHSHDINSLEWDPVRQQYIAIVSHILKGYGDSANPLIDDARRIPHESVSRDLVTWEPIWQIISPGNTPLESGETQFYSMSGVIARGDLLIGLVKVLRDDLNAEPGKTAKEMGDMNRKAAGIGYTVLAWSHDGRTWERDYQPFIPDNPVPGTFDHAMAWGDEQVVNGDETFIYYGGYERGHKIDRFTERHIGLARIPLDRYVSRYAGMNTAELITIPFYFNATSLTVNANIKGEGKIRLLGSDKKPLPGFGWIDIAGDSTAHQVRWQNKLNELQGKAVRIEFQLKEAHLFGFTLK